MNAIRARFAPSPTGDLHLGSALTALASWCLARGTGGAVLLRVEDIDRPRVIDGSEARQLEDLAWLGLDWDEGPREGGAAGPYRQSERGSLYEAAIDELTRQGRVYACDCSRSDIARVASAPHEGEELLYPGTCREKDPGRATRRAPALRLRVEADDRVSWTDGVVGPVAPLRLHAGGDFVLRRGDGVFAYQLAVAVDDLAMGVTSVVRGDDLVASTSRQLLLMRLLRDGQRLLWAQKSNPRYWHLPLVRAADGSRLAKRTPGATVRELRGSASSRDIIGQLGHALGVAPTPAPVSASDLAKRFSERVVFTREPWRVPL